MKLDKRDRAAIFRDRLSAAMQGAGMNRSALARATEVNRSTISQLLDAELARLPNAQLAADCAQTLGVSTDWLLGLTDRPERPGDAIAAAVEVTEADRTPADAQLLEWYREAQGAKIRHVPAALPDLLKTDALLRFEYEPFLGKTVDQALTATAERRDLLRARATDHEIAVPMQELQALARGEGRYAGLPAADRRAQLETLSGRLDAWYPRLRLFLFDARRLYSAPISVFGTRVAVIYVGRFYLAFREGERLRSLAEHFDWLVREAEVDARDAAGFAAGLLPQVK